ncbi:MAG: class I SAM-dependent methyltransferase [Parvularculaceae bacterium]
MKKIVECRACGSKALTSAFSLPASIALGAQRPGFIKTKKSQSTDFVLCDPSRDALACGLLQAAHVYSDLTCRDQPSGRYATTRSNLRSLATEALELISGRDCAALDIGCNDGSLLSFYPRWVDRYGVDPSPTIEKIGDWAWTAKSAFPTSDIDRAIGARKFDIITAASVLESIDEPRAFFARVKSLLCEDGVFTLETLYAPMALTRTHIEAFVGGASAVYSLSVLERLLRDSGLKIFRGALTDKDGGSIRLFITHDGVEDHDFDPWYERLARLWDEENALALRALQPYQAFEQRAIAAREALGAMLADLADKGESAHLLGIGEQSAAVVAWAGEGARVISAAVADGARATAPAVKLDVISETQSRADEPDFLIAPAALTREMLERWRESILLGARMIFVSPEPHIVHAQNYASALAKALAAGDSAGGVETLRAILGAAGAPRLVAETPGSKAASA